MKDQNNSVENNSGNEVVQKRKTNWGFTLFACLATGIIVFLAMNLGEKASKVVDPGTNSKSSNITSNEDSNSNSNSNENSNVNSNVESNSNVTSNTTQTSVDNKTTEVSVRTYRYFGHLEGKSADSYTTLKLYSNGKYDLYVNVCSGVQKYSGNYKETDTSISITGGKNITFTKNDDSLEFDFSKLDACNDPGVGLTLESAALGDK